MRRLVLTIAMLLVSVSAWAQTPPAGNIEYYHTDVLGSVRVVTNEQGQVVRRHDYFAFGEEAQGQPGNDQIRFTGKERDSETLLDYFGRRYQFSQLGRFSTVDPNTNVVRSLGDPQRWNRYTYVNNRPTAFVDKDGREPATLMTILIGAAIVVAAQSRLNAPSPGDVQAGNLQSNPTLFRMANDALTLVGAVQAAGGLGSLARGMMGRWLTRATAAGMESAAGAESIRIGAVLGHFDAGYLDVAKKMGVAAFDVDIAGLTLAEVRQLNQAFLDNLISNGINIKIVTKGFVKIPSTLEWEIKYLLENGYKWSEAGDVLLAPVK